MSASTRLRSALSVAVLLLAAAPALAQSTFLQMTSQPGDFIGLGQAWLLQQGDGTFSAVRNGDNGVSVRFIGPGPLNFWFLDFAAPHDAPLAVGMYEDAAWFPLQGQSVPGLSVAGEGRVCERVRGRFSVLEAVYGPGGEVLRFAADFEQHCNDANAALYGSIRFDSSVSVTRRVSASSVIVPEGDGGAAGAPFRVSLSLPSDVDVTVGYASVPGSASGLDFEIVSGTLTIAAGETVVDAPVRVFGDTEVEGNETFQVVLSSPVNATIGIGEGLGTIVDDDPEKTLIYFDSDPGDYIGEGVVRRFQITDGTFVATRLDAGGVRIAFQGPEFWFLDFVGASGAPIAPGVYEDARRAFSDLTRPGLDVFGDGRGCNALRGRFVVLEASYGAGGEVLRFAADFEQHCEFAEPALVGSVRYQSLATIAGASVRPFQVSEGYPAARAEFTLSWPVPHEVTVAFHTQDGSATAPDDYGALSGVVTFPPHTTAVPVDIPLVHDSREELDETFEMRLDSATGGSVLRSRSNVTILDDDPRYPFDLDHGTLRVGSLAFPNLDGDTYALALAPYTSWEAVVDGASADTGIGNGPNLALRNGLGQPLLYSQPVGTGPARSLRFLNSQDTPMTDRRIVVTSASCTTACGADDTYRIRFYETTYRVARFDTTGGRLAALIVQNPTGGTVQAKARIWSGAGGALGEANFTLYPRATVVVNLSTIFAALNTSGSITVLNDAPYGALAGKVAGLDPATGFAFDTPMLPRPR